VLSEDRRTDILKGFAGLNPHPDIKPALACLRAAGYRTVAFSNSSLDMVSSQITNAGLNESFDDVVSVEKTGSFKPDPKGYRYVAAHLGGPIQDLRLVATHDWATPRALPAGRQEA